MKSTSVTVVNTQQNGEGYLPALSDSLKGSVNLYSR